MNHLLTHRGEIQRQTKTLTDGVLTYTYETLRTIRCRLDLGFVRRDADRSWTSEAGRPPDRAGTLFTNPLEDIRPGDRIKMLAPAPGTFDILGPIDEVPGMTGIHHLEINVVEVAQLPADTE